MTREAIAGAALKLTLAKGLNDVTIDEIAREAFVSPRTVSNYFPSKEEAVLAAGSIGAEQVLDECGGEQSDEPPLKVLCEQLSEYAREHPEQLRRASQLAQLEEKNPSLRPFRVTQQVELVELLSARIAVHSGTDVSTDLYPSLAASGAVSAMVTSLALWSQNNLPDEELPALIQDAFNILTAGYPHPPVVATTTQTAAA
ncbi:MULTISPECIES: TetR/AcrR family transcriptional regulator [unclassified Nesterenkonia]|uniref:TetR/AcrR family transcriptional regulator n=1 Tax=unclassified Nesterenkonia TaxID=2629769 RepID=UPI001F4D10A7|nr:MULTISPECIES: TetR/AcrR family transcriptional regulator [unclassified Nesterenkonia]MCH8560939.1 TetR/AcrR family transcriptional regulator [Nesterenkonia sp. DZ6]MCH8571019.1 TetR/AcrR family transcriptional regulator [Nesterenkonia sp. AY15]